MTSPSPSNFAFIGRVWPALLRDCLQAERTALSDPKVSCFLSRHVLERLVRHIWEFRGLGLTEGLDLFGLMKDPGFIRAVPKQQLDKMHVIRKVGNNAVHGDAVIQPQASVNLLMHLFDVLNFATARHSAHPEHRPTVPFDQTLLKQATPQPQISRAQLKEMAAQLQAKDAELEQSALLLDQAEADKLRQAEQHAAEKARFEQARAEAEENQARLKEIAEERDKEIARLRAELRQQQEMLAGAGAALSIPASISEAQTRRDLIDPMLAEAGFIADRNLTIEHPVTGMPISAENHSGKGYIDYVLWDDTGQPLAVVEAKKSSSSMSVGLMQAQLYADRLEAQHGQRPVIFTTNGHIIHLTDDAAHLPGSGAGYGSRQVEGYPTTAQLRTLIHRRRHRRDLATIPVDPQIADRDYQLEVIRRVAEAYQDERRRRALLVMATGTGKTRVAIATSKLLREAGWVGKVLFLADRTALVEQAHDSFVSLYPDAAPVNLLAEPQGVGQVYVSTYQTMMGLISDDGTTPARFNPFEFELIIVDEAHRSIYHRFKRILDYFDAYVLGLTATPREEVHRDTYLLFDIDDKVPTGAYTLEQAIEDGHLVRYAVKTQDSLFLRRGMRYEELSEDDQLRWDALDWGTDESGEPLPPPDGASPAEINARLYNLDTIRQVLSTLVTHGIKVGGDQLGKTIIFGRTQQHAELIKQEFDRHFPQYAQQAAKVITHSTRYASAAIREFKNPTSGMNVAISVDMLDTGIDVPEVVNLVFFRPVYSTTKFWQMMGRGTRLCPDLFAPGVDKNVFYVFDFCGNAENFLRGDVPDVTGARQITLSERLFLSRARLVSLLDASPHRTELSSHLHCLVQSIPPGHILVRPQDKPVLEHYRRSDAWTTLTESDVEQLGEHIAALPMPTMEDKESAKRFDLLLLQLQLALVAPDASWEKNRGRVEKIATDLLTVDNIAPVVAQRELLSQVSDPEWWVDVTIEELETVRRRLRDLVDFLPQHERKTVVTDFEDEFGQIADFDLPSGEANVFINTSRVEEKLRAALQPHLDSIPMQKLRTARPLTSDDITALESLVAASALEGVDELREKLGADSIPDFIRRLVGLEEAAVRAEFADLLHGSTLSANQIGFIRAIVDTLVKTGRLETKQLFEAPFDAYGNPVELFNGDPAIVVDLSSRLTRINASTDAVG
ncbi:DEAD/DEAH box helicase family protein [Corynebacterium nasicanis]|uniref:DEAD/DEAH box helicase family protein n=1 Tax=Corynebacterium nasicanis TaxID=1448267 RepID=A0ABW1QFS2_9CORY